MEGNAQSSMESGLFCVGIITRCHGVAIDPDQLKHHFATHKGRLETIEIARILGNLHILGRVIKKDIAGLGADLFPVIAQTMSGNFVVLAKIDKSAEKVLVQSATEKRAIWRNIKEIQEKTVGEILLIKKESSTNGAARQFGLGWFIRSAAKYKTILRDCILASMFVQVFSLLSPLVFMIVIDKVLSNNSLSTLDVLVFALIVVSVFEIALNALRTYLLDHTANRIDLMLGVDLFKHLMTLPLSYFENRRVGETIARMKELDNVRQFITGSGIMLFLDLFFLIVFIVVMFLFSPFLSMIVLITMPFLFAASFIITPFLRNRLEDKYTSNAENQSFLVETVSGIETIKSMAAEPRVREKWEDQLTGHVKNGFRGGHLANLINQSTGIVSKVLSVLLLWFGAKEVLQGNLTVGQLIAFNMLSSRVIAPILRLSQIWKEFQQVNVSVARIGDIFNCPGEPGFEPGRISLPHIKGHVQFDHVSFRYRSEGEHILNDISFSAGAGEVIGIVGSTGSGKTTLIKLLQRLYVPEKGRVLIDGVDISVADASWLRRQFGVVGQDTILFNMSIYENISFNAPGADVDQVVSASRLAGVHEFILGLPYGYDTQVGERGMQLSAGQRQRLAIARALVTNPRMLILDEATSALDYESELKIQENMKDICTGRTVFIIAHRISTVRSADRIITLEKGVIIENDSPDELLASNGRYAILHSIQEGNYACQ